MNITIVVAVNKLDFWFCRICIASIRYYYPDIEISIIKDLLNGEFDTNELEVKFNVNKLNLGIDKFGWAASKVHVLLSQELKGKKIFLLDSDIVFCGPVLDKFIDLPLKDIDFIINTEYVDNPNLEWVKSVYLDVIKFKQFDDNYFYPGYFFNTGQMLISPGIIKEKDIEYFFDKDKFPFWKNLSFLPTVDQSLLNYLFPLKESKNEIKIYKTEFMIWGNSKEIKNLELKKIIDSKKYTFLIHWAGCKRTPLLKKMNGNKILIFFENYYYSKIKFGFIKKRLRKIIFFIENYLKRAYKKLQAK